MINRGNRVCRTKCNATRLTKKSNLKQKSGGRGKDGKVKTRRVLITSPFPYQILFKVEICNLRL